MTPSPHGVSMRCASAATPSTNATVLSLTRATTNSIKVRWQADSRFRAGRLASHRVGLPLPAIALLYQRERGGDDARTTARNLDVGTGLRCDGARRAPLS